MKEKLNDSNYRTYTMKIHYSQKVKYVHSHECKYYLLFALRFSPTKHISQFYNTCFTLIFLIIFVF